MPLNMNTVGTGNGVNGGGSTSNISYLVSPKNTITYGDKFPSYYINNYEDLMSKSSTKTLFAQKSFSPFVRMFIFKNEVYGVSYDAYSYTSDGYTGQLIDVSIHKINLSSFVPTQVCRYKCYNNLSDSRDSSTTGRNKEEWSSLFGYYTAIVQSDYIYFMDIVDDTFMYNGSVTPTKVLYWSRFDGHTITHIQKLYIANGTHPDYNTYSSGYMFANIDTFAPINRFNTEFLFHGMTYNSKDYIVTINDDGTLSYVECTFPKTLNVPRGSVYAYTTSVSPYNFVIMENVGFAICRYEQYQPSVGGDSNEGLFKFDVTRNTSSTGNDSFTIANIHYIYSFGSYTYHNGSHYAYPIFNICNPGVVTVGGFVYSGFNSSTYKPYSRLSIVIMLIYNPETKLVEYYKASNPEIKDYFNNFGMGKYSTTVCFVSESLNKVFYVNSGIMTNSNTTSGRETGVVTQDVTLVVINNASDIATSSITINAEQGDMVYCTRKITSYSINNVNHTISGDSKKYKCTANGTVTITSNHGEEEYRPGWIWISASGYIKYIDSSIVDDTTINGNFIAGMKVGDTSISTSGHQNISVPSISTNGLKIDMKGVH